MCAVKSRTAGAKRTKATSATACVRMYRHGLGDCFLLRLPAERGGTFNILIDCGLISVANDPKTTMKRVVDDIKATCGERIDLVVMTHEHWDHVSGFSSQQMQAEFDDIDIGEVWYAWTEDPDNALGKRLRREREQKLKTLKRAVAALRASANGSALAAGRIARIESMLAFFGGDDDIADGGLGVAGAADAKVGKTRAAFDYLRTRPGVKRHYCYPSSKPLSLSGVSGVRVYVLGPPEDEGRLKRSSPTKAGKEVYEFAADAIADEYLLAAFSRLADPGHSETRDRPFDSMFARQISGGTVSATKNLQKLMETVWDPPEAKWRQIDDEWTDAAEALALNLDNHTNNTCLVLAFELLPSKRVLLFAADAQVGNWLSWHDLKWRVKEDSGSVEVNALDLLERTCFYKVGHHGSHNATLRALGLEKMTSSELVAFVPVEKAQALKSGWKQMPFSPLVKRLQEKASGRVVFSDSTLLAPTAEDLNRLSAAERGRFQKCLVTDEDGLYYEYQIDL